jgi:hypothetical protein
MSTIEREARDFAKECRAIAHASVGERCTIWLERALWADRVEAFAQQHAWAVESALAQTDSLMDALERDLNDVGPWGNGYRQAMADLREQLRLRFGGQYPDALPKGAEQ